MLFRRLSRAGFLALSIALIAPVTTRAQPTAEFTFKRGVNLSHWLSQNYGQRTYGATWFGEADIAWIAQHHFDHVRLPVDVRLCLKPDGSLDDAKLEPIRNAIAWSKARGLGLVLDAHFLPGADFNSKNGDDRAFTDPALMERVAKIWRDLAAQFAKEGPWLRFEILNEPVAKENQQLNPFMHKMLASIRETNTNRIVYVTSNRWSAFSTVPDVVLPVDRYIALTIHFYEPLIFTHQRAAWVGYKATMPPISFPGKVPDLIGQYESNVSPSMLREGQELTGAQIESAFAAVEAWVKQKRSGLEVYVGEFGVYQTADAASTKRWLHTVVQAAESRGWGWAVWDYKGGFAARDDSGAPTAVWSGLFER